MNFKCCFFINVLALGLLCFSKPMLGGRLQLRPLSTEEVVRILKENGKRDIKPQGRFFTTGVAAVKGFALGLTKGVGIPLVYEFATSNNTTGVTQSKRKKRSKTCIIVQKPKVQILRLFIVGLNKTFEVCETILVKKISRGCKPLIQLDEPTTKPSWCGLYPYII
uniref:Uncharacterized protein n=1 Tax=Glossina austeni TaxID=7395 RepID=A0A1A9USJ3_GLOAU